MPTPILEQGAITLNLSDQPDREKNQPNHRNARSGTTYLPAPALRVRKEVSIGSSKQQVSRHDVHGRKLSLSFSCCRGPGTGRKLLKREGPMLAGTADRSRWRARCRRPTRCPTDRADCLRRSCWPQREAAPSRRVAGGRVEGCGRCQRRASEATARRPQARTPPTLSTDPMLPPWRTSESDCVLCTRLTSTIGSRLT